MLKRPILVLFVLTSCGERPLDPVVVPASARAINLSGLPDEVDIWMDGQVIAPGLVYTQPSQPLPITPRAHTFGYSSAGASAPEATTESSVADRSFNLIALIRGENGPELRLIAYPAAGQGRITVRAVNVSNDSARVILRAITGAPGGSELTLDVAPGEFGAIDVSGTHAVRVGFSQQESPTTVILQTGRKSDPRGEYNLLEFHDLGFPVSGEVRTLVFHRNPTILPDVYSF